MKIEAYTFDIVASTIIEEDDMKKHRKKPVEIEAEPDISEKTCEWVEELLNGD